jgi:hypothetical protein
MVEKVGGEAESRKECFIICPIGEERSETRERSDKLLRHLFGMMATVS